ncbi:MAG TPA: hypothetical protein VJK54_04270 [Chthoniobacterales bacterium]|nr:hypothetical protein [Chthoniobacterales bacterium]
MTFRELTLIITILFASTSLLFAAKPLAATTDTTLLELSTNPLLCMFTAEEEKALEEISRSLLPAQKSNAFSKIKIDSVSFHEQTEDTICATVKHPSYENFLISKQLNGTTGEQLGHFIQSVPPQEEELLNEQPIRWWNRLIGLFIERGVKRLQQFYLSSTLNERDEEAAIPPLKAFRSYSANSKYQGTHATTISETVVPVPKTWNGCALHLALGKSHEQTALKLWESLRTNFGTQIAHYAFPPTLQKRASIRHFNVLIQQGVAYVLQNAIPILNSYLKNVKINFFLNGTDEVNCGVAPVLEASAGLERSLIHIRLTEEKTTPHEVNTALGKSINVTVSIPETIIPPIGGVSHEVIKEVLEKADAFVIQNLKCGINAGLAMERIANQFKMYNAVCINSKLLVNPSVEYFKNSTNHQSDFSNFNQRINQLLVFIDQAQKNSLQLFSHQEHLYPSTTFLLNREVIQQTNSPLNTLLTKAGSDEIIHPLSDALSLTYKLNKIEGFFVKRCEDLSLSSSSAAVTPPSMTSGKETFIKEIEQYKLQAMQIVNRVTQATCDSLEIMQQISNLITQTILPSATLVSSPLPENLEAWLEPLAQKLEASLKTIEDSATEVALLKKNFLTSQQAYLEASQREIKKAVLKTTDAESGSQQEETDETINQNSEDETEDNDMNVSWHDVDNDDNEDNN